MAWTGACVTLAMGGGPSIGSLFASAPSVDTPIFAIDVYTYPALFTVGLALVDVALLLVFSDQRNVHIKPTNASVNNENVPLLKKGADEEVADESLQASKRRTATRYFIVFCAFNAIFAGYEAAAAPVMQQKYASTIKSVGAVFAVASGVSCAAFLLITFLMKPNSTGKRPVRHSWIIVVVTVAALAGLLYLVDFPGTFGSEARQLRSACAAESDCSAAEHCRKSDWREICVPVLEPNKPALFAAFASQMVAFVVGRVVSGGAYMEAIHSANSAGGVSWLLIGGAGARIAGAALAIELLGVSWQPTFWPFASLAIVLFASLIAFLSLRPRSKQISDL